MIPALGILVAVATGCVDEGVIESPVAAVADAKGRVVLVDLDRGQVVDRLEMRSWIADICADDGTGGFVTAQSGGVATDADNGVGLIGVRRDRAVRYVELKRPNPLGVESVGGRRVLVDFGWEERDGMYACLVDTDQGRVVKDGHLPENNGPVRFAAGSVWSPGVDPDTDQASLRRVDVTTLDSIEVPIAPGAYSSIQCEGTGNLYGWLLDRQGGTRLARFDHETGAVRQAAEVDLADGPGAMVYAGRSLVAVDFSGEDLKRPGDRLLVYDPSTLELTRSIPLSGGPCDAAVWGDRVVVTTFQDRRIVVVDPRTGSIERSIRLPRLAPFRLMIAVLT